MLAYNITRDAISLVIGDSDYLVPRTSPQAAKVLEALRAPKVDEKEISRLVALEYSPEAYSDGQISIMKNGEVTYKLYTKAKFSSIPELIEYYHEHTIAKDKDGNNVKLIGA